MTEHVINLSKCLIDEHCAGGQTISNFLQPTPSESQVNVHPFPFIGVEHLHKKVVHHHSFTQHPGKGSQEEVVEQEGHYLASNLCRRVEEAYMQYTSIGGKSCLQIQTHINALCSFNPYQED